MTKYILVFAVIAGIISEINAQCPVSGTPSSDNGGGTCYINDVTIGTTSLSTSSGFPATGDSYQNFLSNYVSLQQGGAYSYAISGYNSTSYNVFIWVDFNSDGFYESTEILDYQQALTAPGALGTIYIPYTQMADTFKMRIGRQQGAPGWGPGVNDACYSPGWGEYEDYSLIVTCADYNMLSFDSAPVLCWADSINLFSSTSYGTTSWYTGNISNPAHVGNDFWLQLNPNCTDTVVYLRNTGSGCSNGPLDSMQITLMPSPIANILSTDTVQSCSVITLHAQPGPYSFFWNAGSYTDSIVFNSGFGGTLQLTVTDPSNGCSAFDFIWVNISPGDPGDYATVSTGSNFCYNYEVYLNYDSITAPGTCTWYALPSNTYIGSGSQIITLLPGPGMYSFMGVVSNICGTDTVIRTLNGTVDAPYDSLFTTMGTIDLTGAYVLCPPSSGYIDFQITGLQGSVQNWNIVDTTLNFGMNWSGDTIVSLPYSMVTQNHVYAITAILLSPSNCIDSSITIYAKPAPTINFNMPDTSWTCSFPTYIGTSSSVNYSVYDILWSNGDTTTPINVSGPGVYTLYTIDHNTGCIMNDTTVVADQGLSADPLDDTTFVCNSSAYFDANMGLLNVISWEEFTLNWTLIASDNQPEFYTSGGPANVYVVLNALTLLGCPVTDTTLIDYSGNFSFNLGSDITTMSSPVVLNGPSGYSSYNWQPLNTTGQSAQITTSGTYYLTVANGQGCTYTDTIVVNILPTNVNESDNAVMSFYPNPVNEELQIAAASAITEIRIFNPEGVLVSQSNGVNSNHATVPMISLSEGIYVVEVRGEAGVTRTRIVVLHR